MNVKLEEPTEVDFDASKREVLQLIQAYDNGLSEAELSRTMFDMPSITRMNAINALTNEGKVQLCKRGSELIYRALDSKTAANLSVFANLSVSLEERAVYKVIEASGSKGIWNKDIRTQTKLPLTQLSKVLKNLETKKLIKAVKSVAASKRKVYMLYGIEPDKSVTGGAWYSETEFDSSFVTVLHDQCLQFIKKKLDEANEQKAADAKEKKDSIRDTDPGLVSSAEVKEHIDNSRISNVELSLQDIELVLETIVYDGLIEKITLPAVIDSATSSNAEKAKFAEDVKMEGVSDDENDEFINYYRAMSEPMQAASVMRIPCGQCPHLYECQPGGVISPAKCLYLDRWFEE